MSQAFMDQVKISGGADVLKAFKAFSSELQKDLVETLADRQLGQIAQAMHAEVLALRTKTDETYTRKGTGRRWPYLRRGAEVSPGTARNKVASAIAVVPLGSKQRRLYVGKRVGVTGRSGAFYGRLMERGFMLRRSGGWVKSDRQIPGKWPLYRAFKRLKPGAEAEVVRELTEFIGAWKAQGGS
jgi:hypothetical protein